MRAQGTSQETKPRSSSNKGFSLIELLIVVAVILIIAAIAIPNFIASKMRANEAAAVQNLRNITTAEVVYSTTYGIGFSPSLGSLGGNTPLPDQTDAGLIDEVLASGLKSGYLYTYAALTSDTQGNCTSYSISADPQIPGTTGIRHFYADQTGVIRSNAAQAAGSTDPPIS